MSNTNEKIVKALENLQTEVTALRTGQQALKRKVETYHTHKRLRNGLNGLKKPSAPPSTSPTEN